MIDFLAVCEVQAPVLGISLGSGSATGVEMRAVCRVFAPPCFGLFSNKKNGELFLFLG